MMRKYSIIVIVIMLALITSGNSLLEAQECQLFINGGYSGNSNMPFTSYGWNWKTDYVDIAEYGLIDQEAIYKKASFSAGLTYFFARNTGISISATMLKKEYDLVSEYQFDWTWFDGTGGVSDAAWESPADVSLVPVSINLVQRMRMSGGLSMNVYAGAALMFTKVNLNGVIGYGETFEDDTDVYIDYYGLPVTIQEKKTVVAAHAGLDIEKRFSKHLGLCVGFEYFLAPKQEYRWEVVDMAQYDGELDTLYRTDAPDIHEGGDITTTVKLSFYRVYAGVKVYF